MYFCTLVWGELWVDQRKKCTDICDVAQVIAHFLIDVVSD